MKIALPGFKKLLVFLVTAFIMPLYAHAQWAAPVDLSPNAVNASLNEDMSPCLAVNGDTIHVIWSDRRYAGAAIYYKHSYDAGLTWTTETYITDTTGTARNPAMAVSGSTVHVVWIDSSLGHPASFYRRSLDGGTTWGTIYCLDTSTEFWPGVAASGSMVVVSLNKLYAVGNTEVFFNRSMDNGTTWDTEQQLSHAAGRSEDPSIAAQGNNIHLAWNDKRSGQMQIYYIHSSDYGVTWGPETQIHGDESYTAQVCLSGAHVDVGCGSRILGNYNVYVRQSADTGATWIADDQLTSDPFDEAYPFLTRDNNKIHLVYYQISGGKSVDYMYSADGGTTWTIPSVVAAAGESPFIAYTGNILHVIYVDSATNKVFYRRNPTGNGTPSAIVSGLNTNMGKPTLTANPSPFNQSTNIKFTLPENGNASLKVYDLIGRVVADLANGEYQAGAINNVSFDASMIPSGIYLCRLVTDNSSMTTKLILRK